jgi:ATP-binding cassette subfamily B protein
MSTPQPAVMPLSADAGGWLRRMWPVWWAHRRVIVIAFASAAVAMGAQQVSPLIQRYGIDHDIVATHPGSIAGVVTAMAALFILRFFFAWIRRFSGGRIAWDVDHDLRNAVFTHFQGLDFTRLDELSHGQMVSRTNSDLTLIRQLLSQVPTMLSNLLQFLLALVIMLVLSPLLTAAVMPIIPLLFLLSFRMRRVVYPSQWEAQARMADMTGVVDDAVSGARVVRGFGQEEHERSRLLRSLGVLYGSRMRNLRLRSRRSSTLQAIPQIGQGIVLVFGGYLALKHEISIGTLVAFFTYLAQLAAPARQMATLLVTAQQARAGAERVLELLDSLPEVVEPEHPVAFSRVDGEVVFDDVSFGYLRSEPVLSHFNLRLEPGETVAIVGAAGSGKSTVGLLLPRFYDPQSGSVRIDGIDVRECAFDDLRRQIGVVFEDAFLFSGSVRSNIAYGRPDATDEEVVAAAKAAEAHEFITSLSGGYETIVGERGLLLSGGQRQRITLARALLTDPRILLLDDATSSIDARVEEEIHRTLRRLMLGRTTLVVAHRRSTLGLASRIVVLDKGRVLDQGTHDALLGRCALYRALLAGPGEDAEGEGIDLDSPAAVSANAWREVSDGIELDGVRVNVGAIAARAATPGSRLGGASGGGGAMRAALGAPPTEKLLRQIEALPASRDVPDIDVEREIAPSKGPFRFRSYIRPYVPQLIIGMLFVLIDASAGLVGPYLIGYATGHGIELGVESVLFVISGIYLAVQFLDWADMWVETFWDGRTSERLLFGTRARIFSHLLRLGIDYYDREMTGRVLTRMTSDVDTLSQLVQSGLVNALVNFASFFGVAGILCYLDLRLALWVLVVMPLFIVGTFVYQRTSRRAYDRQRDRIAAVNADLDENVSGVRVTQAFRRESQNTENFAALVRGYRDAGVRSQWLQASYFSFAELVGNVAILIVLGVGRASVTGAHSGRAHLVAVGVLVSFLLYLTQLFAPIQQLSQVFDTFQQSTAGLRRITTLLNTAISTPTSPHPVVPGRLRGEIRFQGVHFGYAGTEAEALSGVSFVVSPGESVALVGETGAGKSTVVKLIARFYDVSAGEIWIDGLVLRDLDPVAYRHQLGYVPQEPFLFAGTIRDNIAYGRPGATNAEVEAAARAVGAHEMIVEAGGYLKYVTERGRSLSIGQRQLLCLARALLVDPAILLLDEATSNLDLSSEAKVTHAMGIVASGRTTVLIAHRLQSARRTDRILVVEHGRIVEQGSHEALLAARGRYWSMWQASESIAAEDPTDAAILA